jgi:hypothetical protein
MEDVIAAVAAQLREGLYLGSDEETSWEVTLDGQPKRSSFKLKLVRPHPDQEGGEQVLARYKVEFSRAK